MFRRFVEEVAYGRAARVAVVECQRVHVHPDKTVSQRHVQAAGMSHAVFYRRRPVPEAVFTVSVSYR